MSLILQNEWEGHVCLCALRFPLSANYPSPSPEKMFTLFNFQSLLTSFPSPSLPLTFSTELTHKVLFLLLFFGWSRLPCGAPAVCVNQHLVTHRPQPPVTKCLEKRNWWSKRKTVKKAREGERKRQSEKERLQRSVSVPSLFFFVVLSWLTWLISDWITITAPGDTFRSHTFHIPETYWQTHTRRH